jgi:hypothetical protein
MVRQDVKFEEALAYKKFHEPTLVIEDKEWEAPKDEQRSSTTPSSGSLTIGQEKELETPSSSVERKPRCLEKTSRDAQEHVEAPKSTFKKSRPPMRFSSYMALTSSIIGYDPTNVEEATYQQLSRDAMMEEYHPIMKNDVWDIVSRPEENSMVGSRWIFKIKHVAYGNIEKHKARFVVKGFSQ